MRQPTDDAGGRASTPHRTLPGPDLTHLARLTDGTGLLQHARFGVADRRHGYCLDDNARALWLMARLAGPGADPRVGNLAVTYAAFVDHAWNRSALHGRGRFENFMGYDRHWLPDGSSGEDEDAQARGILALAHAFALRLPTSLREWAGSLLVEALRPPSLPLSLGSPRAWAAALVACAVVRDGACRADDNRALTRLRDEALGHADAVARDLTARLLDRYRAAARADWPWFEDALAYDNARLCEGALAGEAWEPRLREVGIASLRWLCGVQTDGAGRFRPFGNHGFGVPGATDAAHDQQPIEAWASVDACRLAYRITGEQGWLDHAAAAAAWFAGANETELPLIDANGGSADGIGPHGINRNRGAESTLAWLHVSAAQVRWRRG